MQPPDYEFIIDSLITYIQSIQLERKTGLLIVKRGKGQVQAKGTIMFLRGHVVETKLEHLEGTKAFNELCTWRKCSVSFVSKNQQGTMRSISQTAPEDVQATQSEQKNSSSSSSSPLWHSGSLKREEDTHKREQGFSSNVSLTAKAFPTCQLDVALRTLEALHLSRTHRQLFLLINGQRSVEELIHLYGRHPDEIFRLLRDLEYAKVIRIPNSF